MLEKLSTRLKKTLAGPFLPPQRDDLAAGTSRNFQILDPLDFLAEFTQHIPPKGVHLIRYYGYYSKKTRGMRKKAEAEKSQDASPSNRDDASNCFKWESWKMLASRRCSVRLPGRNGRFKPGVADRNA